MVREIVRTLQISFLSGKNEFRPIKYQKRKISITRTDKNLNSRTAKDSQGLARTCQVLDQSLHVSLVALQVLDQSLPVLGNPGDTLTRTGAREKPKPIQGL